MSRPWIPALLGMALAAAAASGAVIESAGVRVVFSEGEERYARNVLGICCSHADILQARLGLKLPGDLTVTLVGGRQFEAELGPARARVSSAFARPSERVVMLHMGKLRPSRAGAFSRTMRHELVHIAVGELVREKGTRLPLWMDEGLAMLYGDMPFERDPIVLTRAVAAGTLIPLRGLTRAFPAESEHSVRLAYLQAEDATRFLVRLKGEAALRELLQALGRGKPFDEALTATHGMHAAELERQWKRSLSTGSGTLDWVWAALSGLSFFTYMAGLVILAFVVQLIRRRRRKEQMDSEV